MRNPIISSLQIILMKSPNKRGHQNLTDPTHFTQLLGNSWSYLNVAFQFGANYKALRNIYI